MLDIDKVLSEAMPDDEAIVRDVEAYLGIAAEHPDFTKDQLDIYCRLAWLAAEAIAEASGGSDYYRVMPAGVIDWVKRKAQYCLGDDFSEFKFSRACARHDIKFTYSQVYAEEMSNKQAGV